MASPDERTTVLLIENAQVVPDPLGRTLLPGWSVAIDGTTIAATGPVRALRERFPEATRLDGGGQWLLPGLVDAHTHLYAALSGGMPASPNAPRTFPQILERVWWRWDKALRDEDNHQSGLIGAAASLRSGITTVLDHHASPHAVLGSLDCLAAGLLRVGLRACLAYEVSDRDGPNSREQGIAENSRFIVAARARPDNLLRGLFGLHAVFSCSDETLQRCAEIGHDLDSGFHLHVVEHRPEVRRFARSHNQRIPDYLAALGILGPSTIAAHTVQVNQADIRTLKRTGAFNVHNPRSNMGNGVGVAPVSAMFAEGQPVGLGSDGFYDIPQEMVTAKLLQNLSRGDPSTFSDRQALEMAYGHNVAFAQRLFGCPLGKVIPGAAADLILVVYDPPAPVTEDNLAGHIVAALTSAGVRTALVNGKVVMHNGEVTGIDHAAELARARELTARIWQRL
jgi:putative selenium metabolism protein SsnA